MISSAEVFVFSNKNKYIGQFKNGLKDGFGIEINPEGTYIYGNWKDNKEDGYVRIFNRNNEIIFSGEMISGKPLKKLNSNGVEVGCLIGDCENGFGHYLYENGDKYIGEWVNGIMQGYSTYQWGDNSKYVGEFFADAPTLGRREGENGKIEPAVPGMIMTIDKNSFNSSDDLESSDDLSLTYASNELMRLQPIISRIHIHYQRNF